MCGVGQASCVAILPSYSALLFMVGTKLDCYAAALEWGVRAGSMWPLLVKRHMPKPMIKDLMKAILQVLFATKDSFNLQMFLIIRRSPSCGRSHRTISPTRWACRKVLVGKAQAKSTPTRKRSDFSRTISSTCACVEEQERVQHAPRRRCVQGSGLVFARSAICHLHQLTPPCIDIPGSASNSRALRQTWGLCPTGFHPLMVRGS